MRQYLSLGQVLQISILLIIGSHSVLNAHSATATNVDTVGSTYSSKVCLYAPKFLDLNEMQIKQNYGKPIAIRITKISTLADFSNVAELNNATFKNKIKVSWLSYKNSEIEKKILVISTEIRSRGIDAAGAIRVGDKIATVEEVFGAMDRPSKKSLAYGCDLYKLEIKTNEDQVIAVIWSALTN